MMKTFFLAIFLFFSLGELGAQDRTVMVRETSIPILIERVDNEWMDLRIEAQQGQVLNDVTLRFADGVRLKDIQSVKLFYSGTEAPDRKNRNLFTPINYISSMKPGDTFAANASYSVLKAEQRVKGREVVLKADQMLFPGTNFFWISLRMKPSTPMLTQIEAEVVHARIDGQEATLNTLNHGRHYVGVGVRHAGDDGAESFRIPGLVTTKKGTLLATYDVRYNSSKDLQEYVEIGLSRSMDGGKSWEKMRVPMSMGQYGGLPKAQNGVGDPAILVDEKTGTIWIMAIWLHGAGNGAAWWNSFPGMDRYHTAQLLVVKSEDDGRTWSDPMNITEQVKDPSWYLLLQGPGRGISMHDGTLVFACQYIGADRMPNAGIIYSRDHGQTWQISSMARSNTTEAQVAEVEPGVLMLNMRDNRGGSRAVCTTTDLGRTWKEHVSSRGALQEPICMASLIHVKAKDNVLGKELLLFSNPNDPKKRHRITIKASLDGGVTWPTDHQLLLDEREGWGYSCLTMIDRETVGILYESSVAHMTFQAIKLKDLIRGE